MLVLRKGSPMRNFIKNWNFKKHVAAETMFYTSIALIGNSFFGKNSNQESARKAPLAVCKTISKKQKVFNGVLLGCFLVDLAGGYCLLKGLKKIVK
jgi:hypothetical protein